MLDLSRTQKLSKKILALLAVFFVVVQFFTPYQKIYSDEKDNLEVPTLNITDFSIEDESKNKVDKDGGTLNIDQKVTIYYKFDVPSEVKADDQYKIQLPKGFIASEEGIETDIVGEHSKNTLAKVNIKGSNITVTFTQYGIKAKSMELYLTAGFDNSVIDGSSKSTEIIFTINNTIYTIPINFIEDEKKDPTILKTCDVDNSGNLHWKITIKPNQRLSGVEVIDSFSDYQTYEPGSFKVNGKAIPEDELKFDEANRTIKYEFPNIIKDKQEITLTTSVNDDSPIVKSSKGDFAVRYFENVAKLNIKDTNFTPKDSNLKLESKCPVELSPDFFKKLGYLYKDRIIWEVNIDAKYSDLINFEYTDNIEEGIELIMDEGESHELRCSDKSKPVSFSKNGFVYKFPKIAKGTKITINYETRITDRERYMKKDNDFAIYHDNALVKSDDLEMCTILGEAFAQPKMIDMKAFDYDYSTKEITWGIIINNSERDGLVLKNPNLVDIIPKGQAYVKDSLSISKQKANEDVLEKKGKSLEFKKVNSEDVVYDEESGEVTYNFNGYRNANNEISDPYLITLKTKIVDPNLLNSNKVELTNNAKITNEYGTCDDSASQIITDSLISKMGEYDASDDTVEWSIDFNKSGLEISSLYVEDIFPSGITLDKDSVKLYEGKINWNGKVTAGEEVLDTSKYNFNLDNNFVKLNMPKIDKCYLVKFKTNLNGTKPDQPNTVTIKGNGEKIKENSESKSISKIISLAGGIGSEDDTSGEEKPEPGEEKPTPEGEEKSDPGEEEKPDPKEEEKPTAEEEKPDKPSSSSHNHKRNRYNHDDYKVEDKKEKPEKPDLSDVIIIPSKPISKVEEFKPNKELSNNDISEIKIVPINSEDNKIDDNKEDKTTKAENKKIKKLPQSGSMLDQKVLVFIGSMLISIGLAFGFKRKKISSKIK